MLGLEATSSLTCLKLRSTTWTPGSGTVAMNVKAGAILQAAEEGRPKAQILAMRSYGGKAQFPTHGS
jgi:hypothetical protein